MKMISKRREWLFLAIFLIWAAITFVVLPVYFKNLVLAGILGVAGLLALAVLVGSGAILAWSVSPRYRQVFAHGRPASAVVLECTNHGWVSSSPLGRFTTVTLHLRVEPEERQPYETKLEALVPVSAVPQAGATLAVKYDPGEPAAVALAMPPRRPR